MGHVIVGVCVGSGLGLGKLLNMSTTATFLAKREGPFEHFSFCGTFLSPNLHVVNDGRTYAMRVGMHGESVSDHHDASESAPSGHPACHSIPGLTGFHVTTYDLRISVHMALEPVPSARTTCLENGLSIDKI